MSRLRLRALLPVGLLVAVGAPILAQQNAQSAPQIGTPDPSRVTAGTYKVDNEHTMVRWQVDHLGITPYFGIFGQITGSLVLDPAKIEASKVDISIPIGKVTTASPGLTAHLLKAPAQPGEKPDFFGPSPADARFVSTAISRGAQPNTAIIKGDLILNGVTKPVQLEARFHGAGRMPVQMGGGDMVGFEATATIKRSDFGVSMAIPMVSDEVSLNIVAAFTK